MPVRKLVLAVLITVFTIAPAAAKDPIYTSTFSSLAIRGYDPVAYFTEHKPVEGNSAFEFRWKGATWRFSSTENMARFRADPEAFAPQYGGYCAWAVSQGYTASSDPTAWRIVGDKLYLNYSHDIQRQWAEDIDGNITKADTNWPGVLK